MDEIISILTEQGTLGCWIIYSILRERWLLKKMEELSLRFEGERQRWNDERTRWLKTLGRKLSDSTIDDTISRG